jgi:ribosomal subunit interface protein
MSGGNITVGSHNVELGTYFREQAQEQILKLAKKYLGDLTMASVHVNHEGRSYQCSVTVQMGGYNVVVGQAKAKDVPLAFRTALGKVSKQLRRAKRLLREDRANQPERVATA